MTLADRRKREKEQRKDDIVNAAEKLIFSRGYDNVSMNDIANEAEVNKALLYYYFEDKASLFFAIVLRAGQIYDGLVKARIVHETTGLGKLNAIGKAMIEFATRYPNYYDAYFYWGSPRFQVENSERSQEVWENLTYGLNAVAEAVREGLEDGTIKKGLNPIEVTLYLHCTTEGIIGNKASTVKLLESEGISLEKFLEDSLNLVMQSISVTGNK